VPEAVAERVHAPAVLGAENRARLVHVGDVGERLVAEPVLVEHGNPGLGVELAVEALGEGELLGASELLVAEDDHGVLVHRRADRFQRRLVGHRAQVHRAGLGGEDGMQRSKRERHGGNSSARMRAP
jgi:hypothetical protein